MSAERTLMNNPKVGDRVLVRPNALFAREKTYMRTIVQVGNFPSLWLPRGETIWGAVFMIDETYKPDDWPSSPMRRDQFSWDDEAKQWELQLQ